MNVKENVADVSKSHSHHTHWVVITKTYGYPTEYYLFTHVNVPETRTLQ